MLPRSTCCQSPFVRGASLYTKRWSRWHTLARGKKFPKIAKARTWNHNRRVELHSHRSWCRCLRDRTFSRSTSIHLTHSYDCGRKRWNLNSRSIQSPKRKEALHKNSLVFEIHLHLATSWMWLSTSLASSLVNLSSRPSRKALNSVNESYFNFMKSGATSYILPILCT